MEREGQGLIIPQVTEEETEAARNEMLSPGSHSWQLATSDSKFRAFTMSSCLGLFSQLKNKEISGYFFFQVGSSSWHNSKLLKQASRIFNNRMAQGKEILLLQSLWLTAWWLYQYNFKTRERRVKRSCLTSYLVSRKANKKEYLSVVLEVN